MATIKDSRVIYDADADGVQKTEYMPFSSDPVIAHRFLHVLEAAMRRM